MDWEHNEELRKKFYEATREAREILNSTELDPDERYYPQAEIVRACAQEAFGEYAEHVEIVPARIAQSFRPCAMQWLIKLTDASPVKMPGNFVQILRSIVLRIPQQFEEYAIVKLNVA